MLVSPVIKWDQRQNGKTKHSRVFVHDLLSPKWIIIYTNCELCQETSLSVEFVRDYRSLWRLCTWEFSCSHSGKVHELVCKFFIEPSGEFLRNAHSGSCLGTVVIVRIITQSSAYRVLFKRIYLRLLLLRDHCIHSATFCVVDIKISQKSLNASYQNIQLSLYCVWLDAE